jgi:hypothetical protein
MRNVTIVLAGLSPLLEDLIVHLLRAHPGASIVRGIINGTSLVDVAFKEQADVIIVSHERACDLAALDHGLASLTALSIVALTPDGGSACIHRLVPQAVLMKAVSGHEILELLTLSLHRVRS